jgi:hypothetical protein
MAEHPIIFSAESIRAILDGRKTQTRRVVKPQPVEALIGLPGPGKVLWLGLPREEECPYGVPGDTLWVKETWATHVAFDNRKVPEDSCVWYRADDPEHENLGKWRSPLFMPRWASRIALDLAGVRVERLQDITEEDDAWAEGVQIPGAIWGSGGPEPRDTYATNVERFAFMWDAINGKRGYGWATNPWVWVVEFKQRG